MRIFVVIGILLVTTSLAFAKPLAGDKHVPPLALEPSSTWLQLHTHNDSGYGAQAKFAVLGATSKTDRLQLEWKQGGKVVGTAKCSAKLDTKLKALFGDCTLDTQLKARGRVEVDIVYSDDQTDTDYLVATLALDVRQWKSIGKTIEWGYVPDDLLALAFVSYETNTPYDFSPIFQFWSTAPLQGKKSQLRCTVDGQKLPDFDASIDNNTNTNGATIEHVWTTEKDRKPYTFTHFGMDPGFKWGTKAEHGDDLGRPLAADHPGKWDCALRVEGKTVRKFMFAVTNKGRLVPSELQSGKWPLRLYDHVVLVDMRIPDDNGLETRIRTDALKKGIGWGLPWPEHPKAKEAQAALPRSMGIPD